MQDIHFQQSQFPAVDRGEVAVIDSTTDRVVSVITLNGKNPITEFQFSPNLNRILISSVGDLTVIDDGIEAINPDK